MALGDTLVARCVDELEVVVLLYLGDDAHMTHSLATACASVEEHKVTRFELVACNAAAVVNLSARSAVEAETKFLEHIAGETRAVESTRTCLAIAIGNALELEGEAQEIFNLTVGVAIIDGCIVHLLAHCGSDLVLGRWRRNITLKALRLSRKCCSAC